MVGFEYFTPTKVVFGKGAESKAGALVKEQGAKKVLVHYGSESARRSGLLDRVCDSLKEAGIPYVTLGGVVPNPHLSLIYEGIELCRKEGVDFLLPIGGGSVIDSAKAIGYGVPASVDVWEFYEKKAVPETCLPIGAVLTIAAAGSEMSNSSVITNDQKSLKRGLNTDMCRPRFAVMNPELTLTLPGYHTAAGIADILMHTLERYFTAETAMEITDSIAEGLMRTVIHNGQILTKDPGNYDARAEMMWAGSLSHNGLTGCGGGIGDFACHQIGHELSGMFDAAHGASLTAVWGSWARYVYKTNPARFAKLATEVLRVERRGSDEETAIAGIEATEAFFRSIGMPTSIGELVETPVTDEQLQEMAEKCSFYRSRTIGTFRTLDRMDIEQIYFMARQ